MTADWTIRVRISNFDKMPYKNQKVHVDDELGGVNNISIVDRVNREAGLAYIRVYSSDGRKRD